MITLKTVLRSGGEYNPEHVLRMQEMLDRYVDCPARFVCYSDVDIPGMEVRPLLHAWPGWWSKLEIFRDNDEQSFYIDLDMTIDQNITDIVSYKSNFIALRNMNARIAGIGSAMMGWVGNKPSVYVAMECATADIIKKFSGKMGTPYHGDQGLLWDFYSGNFEFYQDIFPNRIKRFNERGGCVKVFYGRNRPWERG